MTRDELAADMRRFLRQKGNKIQKIPTGASGIHEPIGKLTREQVRDRTKRNRGCEIDRCKEGLQR